MRSSGLWRRVKKHRSYTVEEAARLLGKCRGTVRRWIKTGLPTLSDQRPLLILGADLIDHLQKSGPPKQTCRLDECFCLACRAPRKPAFDAVEYFAANTSNGNMRALCVVCSTVMHKRVSATKLDALGKIVNVAIIPCAPPKS